MKMRDMYVCPECGNEWPKTEISEVAEDILVKYANGSTLAYGDSAIVIWDLKVKGSSSVAKAGTMVKNIRLVASLGS